MVHSSRQIVFACDFEDAARAAFDALIDLAGALRARVLLVHVQPSRWHSWLSSGLVDRHARDRLETWADRLREQGVEARAELITEGDVATELAAVADREQAYVLVVGGAEHPGGKRRFEDRTVEKVVRLARQPVWVSKGRPGVPRRILCGVDPSEPSAEAVRLAVEVADQVHADASVVHAVANPDLNPLGMSPEEMERAHEAHKQRAAQQLEAFLARQSTRRLPTRVQWGSPADVLVHIARDEDIDLLVLGAGRRGALKRKVLGTTAGTVLYESPTSVLLAGEGGIERVLQQPPRPPASSRSAK